jgi:hypothetical protein
LKKILACGQCIAKAQCFRETLTICNAKLCAVSQGPAKEAERSVAIAAEAKK